MTSTRRAARPSRSTLGADAARASRGSSFVCDLRKWLELMDSYEAGGFM